MLNRSKPPSLKRLAEYSKLEIETLKELKETKNGKFKQLVEDFLKKVDRKIIAVANLKGGVGKSTIANIFQVFTPNSVVLNIDLNQNAKKIKFLYLCLKIKILERIRYMSFLGKLEKLTMKYSR